MVHTEQNCLRIKLSTHFIAPKPKISTPPTTCCAPPAMLWYKYSTKPCPPGSGTTITEPLLPPLSSNLPLLLHNDIPRRAICRRARFGVAAVSAPAAALPGPGLGDVLGPDGAQLVLRRVVVERLEVVVLGVELSRAELAGRECRPGDGALHLAEQGAQDGDACEGDG